MMWFFNRKSKKIFLKHEKIGFPKISEEVQYNMLLKQDFEPINSLVNCDMLPTEVLDYYITIDKNFIITRLKVEDLLDRYNENTAPSNGVILFKEEQSYRVILKDRGEVMRGWKFNSDDELKIFFANLILSVVPKFRNLSPI